MITLERNCKVVDPLTGLDSPFEFTVNRIRIQQGTKTDTGMYITVTLYMDIADGFICKETTKEYPDAYKFDECVVGYDMINNVPIIDDEILGQKLAPFDIVLI